MTPVTGRPRSAGSSPTGRGTEQDILYAGARLFCTVGFGSTSTHALADAAGIRQASLYHYFPGKHAVLLSLLLGTVQPSIETARELLLRPEPAPARLWALCVSDVRLLTAGEVNLGALYLLPELDDEKFAPFHHLREELVAAYRELVAACPGVPTTAGAAGRSAGLVLGLVESVILQRRRSPQSIDESTAPGIADAALKVLDLDSDEVRDASAAGREVLDTLRKG